MAHWRVMEQRQKTVGCVTTPRPKTCWTSLTTKYGSFAIAEMIVSQTKLKSSGTWCCDGHEHFGALSLFILCRVCIVCV
jgi:hypothetical protein